MGLETGLTGTAALEVEEKHTAPALGSGDVEVLATPAVVALCEAAAVNAVDGRLGAGETSVGIWIALEHTAPTVPGAAVRAEAVLTGVEGRKLTFEVTAWDTAGRIAGGEHRRVIVDRDRFLDTASSRR